MMRSTKNFGLTVNMTEYTAAFVLSFFMIIFFLLYCYYYSVMYVTVMPVSVYEALAFVFGFIQIN